MSRFVAAVVLTVLPWSIFGQQGRRSGGAPPPGAETPAPANNQTPAPAEAAVPAVEKFSKTQHSIQAGGTELAYTATAGTLVLRKEDGKPKASIFFVAYTLDSAKDKSKRALTFSFNGGPGSSSIRSAPGSAEPHRARMRRNSTAMTPISKRWPTSSGYT